MRQGIKYGRQFIILKLETLPKTKLKIIYALVVQLVKNLLAMHPIASWQIDGETVVTVSDFIFGGLQNHCRW